MSFFFFFLIGETVGEGTHVDLAMGRFRTGTNHDFELVKIGPEPVKIGTE